MRYMCKITDVMTRDLAARPVHDLRDVYWRLATP